MSRLFTQEKFMTFDNLEVMMDDVEQTFDRVYCWSWYIDDNVVKSVDFDVKKMIEDEGRMAIQSMALSDGATLNPNGFELCWYDLHDPIDQERLNLDITKGRPPARWRCHIEWKGTRDE